jgi:hypothetical protein
VIIENEENRDNLKSTPFSRVSLPRVVSLGLSSMYSHHWKFTRQVIIKGLKNTADKS